MAKIRLVELRFEEAIGTFNYVDGHYVKPHGFRKGSIKINQTFTLNVQVAAVQHFMNLGFCEKTANGDYLFVDNFFVNSTPIYADYNETNKLEHTYYDWVRIDECHPF